MNYIKLINAVWDLREKNQIDKNEFDLYLFLLHTSNKQNWENPISLKTTFICAAIGINRNALIIRRKKLIDLNLIEVKEGIKDGIPAEYKILSLENSVSQNEESVPEKPKSVPKIPKSVLKFPFNGEKFLEAWAFLLKTKKWKIKQPETLQKNLNSLAKFKEEFATILVLEAADNNWQGVVFPGTVDKYKKWLEENGHTQSNDSDTADNNGYSAESWLNTGTS